MDRLRFIREAKELGFTLNEIKELLLLPLDPSSSCGEVKRRAEAKVAYIEEKRRADQSALRPTIRFTHDSYRWQRRGRSPPLGWNGLLPCLPQ